MKQTKESRSSRASVRSKLMSLIACLLVAVTLLCSYAPAVFAADDSNKSASDSVFDLVIVMDISGSMRKSDKNAIAIEAAKMLIDMTLVNNSRVAVITYGYDPVVLGPGGLTPLDSYENKAAVKSWLDTVTYPEANGTDTGAALTKAKELLDTYGDADHQKAILLFTDGDVTDVDHPDVRETSGRTNAMSIQECNNVAMWGNPADGDCPIYAIGLNAKINGRNTITTNGKNMITGLATASGGHSTIVSSIDDILPFYQLFLAELTDAEIISGKTTRLTGEWQSETVNIPNSSVAKANIIMLTSVPLTQIKITDPTGANVVFDSSNCVLSSENNYSMIELNNPIKGDWVVNFRGTKGATIQTDLLFLYDDMQSVQKVTSRSGSNSDAYINKPIDIQCHLTSNDIKVTDVDVYQDMAAKVSVLHVDTAEIVGTVDLTFDPNQTAMCGTYTPDRFGTFEFSTIITSNSFYRKNPAATVTVVDHDPVNSAKLKNITVYGTDTTSIYLDDYFTDPDGLPLSYEIDYNGSHADVDSSVVSSTSVSPSDPNAGKTQLTVSGLKKGSDPLKITVFDASGNTIEHTVKIKVKSVFVDIILPILLGLIVLGAIIATVLYFIPKMKELKGRITILEYTDGINYYDADPIPLHKLQNAKGSQPLSNLINIYARDQQFRNGNDAPVVIGNRMGIFSAISMIGTIGSEDYTITFTQGKDSPFIIKLNNASLTGNGVAVKAEKVTMEMPPMKINVLNITDRDNTLDITVKFNYTER